MNNEEKPKLALRVFRRTAKHLILLWKRADGVDPMGVEITFRDLKDPKAKDVRVDARHINIDEPVESEGPQAVNISSETVVCMIKDPGLDASTPYYVKVTYGDESQGIRVTPVGVFPSHEREERAKNVHLMGWDDAGQTWRKLSAVKGPNGQWFLGTAAQPCEQCGPGDSY